MRGITHLLFALSIALVADLLFSIPVLFYPLILLAGVFPDIDYAGSILGRHAKLVGLVAGHRTVFHSLWMAALCAIIAFLIRPWLAVPVALGYLSHLALDALNHSGIAWLYPLYKTKGFCRSGGLLDTILLLGFLGLDVLLVLLRLKVI
jgi:inner membrane protein